MSTGPANLFAVIGRSEDQPLLYHMDLPWARAERLRQRREDATGRSCYIVPMGAWLSNPMVALQRAEAGRFGEIAKG